MIPPHSRYCNTYFRGCSPDCPKDKWERQMTKHEAMASISTVLREDVEKPLRETIRGLEAYAEELRMSLDLADRRLTAVKENAAQLLIRSDEHVITLRRQIMSLETQVQELTNAALSHKCGPQGGSHTATSHSGQVGGNLADYSTGPGRDGERV